MLNLFFIKRSIYALAFVGTALLFYLLILQYEEFENARSQRVMDEIKMSIKKKKISKPQANFIKSYLEDHPNTVYFLLLDPIENKGIGIVNVENFSHGAKYIDKIIQEKSMLQAFDLLRNTHENPNPYIKLAQDYWVEQSLQIKYAYLNPMNYYQWGMRGPVVLWGLYIWYVLGGVLGLMYFMMRGSPGQYVSQKPKSESLEEEKENIKFLQERAEKQLEEDDAQFEDMIEDDEDDTKVDDIPSQVWIRLMEAPDLKDWDTKGQFYVREDKKGLHAIGFPWASSIITRKEVIFPEFIFEVEGRVLTGTEGFVLLFRVGKHYLTWVLGGWENTQSVILGYDNTKTYHQILHKKWYHVRVEFEDSEVIGYIDGRTAWALQKSDITHDSPDVGFQKGLGVGVYKTTTKFRNIRVLKV